MNSVGHDNFAARDSGMVPFCKCRLLEQVEAKQSEARARNRGTPVIWPVTHSNSVRASHASASRWPSSKAPIVER